MKTIIPNSKQMSLISLALAMLLASLGISIPNIALPEIAKQFGAVFSETQLVIVSYLLAVTIWIVIAGKVGDIFGRKRIFLLGLFLFSAAALATGLSQTLWVMILARVVQGLGAAIVMSMSLALMSDSVSKEKLGSAMGLMGTMSAVGTAAGPSIGGMLISNFGWRSVFFFMTSVGVIGWLTSKYFVVGGEKARTFEPKKIDFIGMVVLASVLSSYSLGLTLNSGDLNRTNFVLMVIAGISVLVFIKFERTIQNPLIRLELFNRTFSSNLAMNVVVSTVMMSTLIVGPFYLTGGLGLSSLSAGAVMSVGPILSILTGIPAGKIVDLLGAKLMTLVGLLVMVFGTISLSVFPSFFGLYGYLFSILVLSPGYQLFQAANNTVVMKNVSSAERGLISGLLSLSRNLGLITGASFMGAVFSYAIGVREILLASSSAVAAGMKATFWVATGLLLVAVVMAFLSVKQTTKKEELETDPIDGAN